MSSFAKCVNINARDWSAVLLSWAGKPIHCHPLVNSRTDGDWQNAKKRIVFQMLAWDSCGPVLSGNALGQPVGMKPRVLASVGFPMHRGCLESAF